MYMVMFHRGRVFAHAATAIVKLHSRAAAAAAAVVRSNGLLFNTDEIILYFPGLKLKYLYPKPYTISGQMSPDVDDIFLMVRLYARIYTYIYIILNTTSRRPSYDRRFVNVM